MKRATTFLFLCLGVCSAHAQAADRVTEHPRRLLTLAPPVNVRSELRTAYRLNENDWVRLRPVLIRYEQAISDTARTAALADVRRCAAALTCK